jgi:L-serine/L-threonine ammonia-lyase
MFVEKCQSHLWTETPLIFSNHLSTRLGRGEYAVYLKLENLQPSHSFKYRGVSLFIQRALATHGPTLRVVCASGGNAGLAAACAAQVLGVRCTIYLPNGVDARTHVFLHNVGAEVVVIGRFYFEALREAEAAVRTQPNAYVAARDFSYHRSSVLDFFPAVCSCLRTTIPRCGRATHR